jgi:hypothetical protein
MNSTLLISTYSLYLLISISLTIWVARTLSKSGRPFLIECFDDKPELADSVNHLLVVGFYLVNFGFICHFLKVGTEIASITDVFEALGTKIGTVLLVLGGMHFFNLFLFQRIRRQLRESKERKAYPPVPPTYATRS